MNTLIPENLNIEQYQSNLEQCLKATYQFGGTLYTNICNGETYYILNGFWDFAVGFLIAISCIAFTVAIYNLLKN